MTLPYKIIAALLLLLGVFAGGYFTGKGQREITERLVVKEGETRTITVEKIVTVIRTVKPDGTVEEKTETADRTIDKNKDISEVSKDSSSKLSVNQWGVGGLVKASLKDSTIEDLKVPKLEYGVVGSMRVIGDIWADLQVTTDKQLGIGLRVEF